MLQPGHSLPREASGHASDAGRARTAADRAGSAWGGSGWEGGFYEAYALLPHEGLISGPRAFLIHQLLSIISKRALVPARSQI